MRQALLFLSGMCFAWACSEPHVFAYWFGFGGALFGALSYASPLKTPLEHMKG